MIPFDQKKAVTMVLGPSGPEPKDDEGDVLEQIAHDLIQAIHSKSGSAVKSALQGFLEEIQLQDEEQDQGE